MAVMRLALAVDGQGMFSVQQKLGWFFDPRRLLAHAHEQPNVQISSAFWYLGLKEATDQRPFRDALTSLGFTVRVKPMRELSADGDQRQFARANLDLEMAIDLMAVAHRTDELWLLSASRDLDRLTEVLRIKGVKVVLIGADGMVPRELRNAVDHFIDLSDLRLQLEKGDAPQPLLGRG